MQEKARFIEINEPASPIKAISQYQVKETIGTGTYGSLYKANKTFTEKEFSIEMIDKSSLERNMKKKRGFFNRVMISQTIKHPQAIRLYECLESKSSYFLVESPHNGVRLNDYLKSKKVKYLDELSSVRILKQLLEIFQELDGRRIVLRHFGADHIFLSGERILVDVVEIAELEANNVDSFVGPNLYMAYEMPITPSKEEKPSLSKNYLWFMRNLFYQLLVGCSHAPDSGILSDKSNLKHQQDSNYKHNQPMSTESADFLDKILDFGAKKPIAWAKIANHPIFQKYQS